MATFIRTEAERKVIDSIFYPKIGNSSDEILNQLIDTVAKWQFYVGIKNPSSQELLLIVQFIQKQYSQLSCQEISLAVDLGLEGKLDVTDLKPYGVFSPLYVSGILNAYIDYKMPIVREVVERYERINPPNTDTPKMTVEEQAKFMRDIILSEYRKFKENGTVNDYLSIIYDFLKKTKRLIITEELKEKAITEGERMYAEYISKERAVGNFVDKFWNIQDKKSKTNKMSREYCLIEYFKNVDIEALVNSIKDNEFS